MNFMTTVVKELKESSRLDMEKLEAMVTNSTTTQLTNIMNMKMVLETDLSLMNPTFQIKAKQAIEKHFEDTLFPNVNLDNDPDED